MNILKNKKGFTLAEVMVASGLVGITLLFAGKFFLNVNKTNSKVSDDLTATLGKLQFEKIINFDISNSRYSLNNLYLEDDNEKNLFDFYFDVPCLKNCQRELILTAPKQVGQYSRPVYLLTSDRTYNKDIIFSPKTAYSSSALSFVSLNKGNFLATRKFSPWKRNKLLLVYSPSPVRKEGNDPSVTPPDIISYLGWVGDSKKLQREIIQNEDEPDVFISVDPRDNATIKNEDIALRKMPYIHGLSNDVYITSVNIVRYRLKTEKMGNKKVTKLYRAVKKVGSGYLERSISDQVKSLKFMRPDVSTAETVIELEID